jgi:hypothetical protein
MAIPADYQHPGNTGGAATAPAGQPAGVNSLTPTGPGPWELYYRSTGAKISELFNSHRPDAEREARVIVTSRNFNPALFGVRTQQQAAAPSQSGPWEIINTTNNQLFTVDGQPRHFPSEEEARSWLRGMGLTGSNFVVRSAGDTPSRYEIYDTDTGETKEAFNSANDQSAQEYLEDYRRMGPHAHGPDEAARRFGVRRART